MSVLGYSPMSRMTLAAIALAALLCPVACVVDDDLDIAADETGEVQAQGPSVCINAGSGECRFDALGQGCQPIEWDACAADWSPAACIDIAEICYSNAGGPCEVGFVNACEYQP